MKILMTGSTGFVGSKLVQDLENQGHDIYHLVLNPKGLKNEIIWNPEKGTIEKDKIPDCNIVINLAGHNISQQRWSRQIKKKIFNSRINSTKLLFTSLQEKSIKPNLWINASAVGFYGETGVYLNTEEDKTGKGFLSKVCEEWEKEASNAKIISDRVVILRFGVVLAKTGGVLRKLEPIFNLCAGGKLGDGKQYFSWVSLNDIVGIVNYAISTDISGVYNAVSPEVITNETFTNAFGEALNKPVITRVPSVLLKLKYGQMARETMLQSCKASSGKLSKSGYKFNDPNIFIFLKNEFQK